MTYRLCFFSIIILYLSLDYAHQYLVSDSEIEGRRDPDFHFDYLIFAQHWPVTICKIWKQINSSNECDFPKRKDRWSIHGVWPAKFNKSGPGFCNDSWPFDPKEIESIEDDLDQAWTNVYRGSDHHSLWRHEWDKHGTCGAVLKPLNSQFKYFSKGIEWNEIYLLSDMLKAAKIFPSDSKTFKAEEFGNAVRARTGKLPMVACMAQEHQQFLDELRICFDKKLNVIDCDPFVDDTCDVSKGVIFPAHA